MALTPRLDLRQSQQLVMTPQLQQAIKLLQLSNLELSDYVMTELERNPLLELGDPNATGALGADEFNGEGGGTQTKEDLFDGPESPSEMGGESTNTQDQDGLIAADKSMESGMDLSSSNDSALDTDMGQNIYNNDAVSDRTQAPIDQAHPVSAGLGYEGGGAIGGGGGILDERSIDQTLEGAENLHDYLNRQMAVAISSGADRLVAAHLIDLVDESGYIDGDAVIDIPDRLGCTLEDLDRILSSLQTLEPVGVFARSLSECLAIQLRELDRYDPAMEMLVENLDMLAKRDMAGLKRLCGVDNEDLTDMVREIRELSPKPGLAFGGEAVQPVIPDIFVTKSPAGTWVVELNNDTLPKVLVNSQYLSELTDVSSDKDAKNFISECVSNANWLVKALDQRARTILKVSTALVKKQNMFFEHGVRYLKPLTLKDIADEIEMHESTVSRVTNNKFMTTQRGMFELKYFFTSSINAGDGGDAHSSESVKFRLKELIDNEDPKKILSDDKLVTLMKVDGVDIARRTVAKYREAMKIPSSVQRRRQKNMGI